MTARPRKYFGTDGVRGVANRAPMDAQTALRLGRAAGAFFRDGKKRHRIIIGKDTRLSGYMIESALLSGICSMGTDVYVVGPMPTPAIAYLASSMRADAGIVISASHNPFEDNGIKFFGPDGMKLPDEQEEAIESLMERTDLEGPTHDGLGKAFRIDDAEGRYIVYAKATFPRRLDLEGRKVVVDCANGAAYKVAPAIFTELGAKVVTIGDRPDGVNINEGCGSTHPEVLAARVLAESADLGVALDGDGDRAILVDAAGQIADGDDVLFVAAGYLQARGRLSVPRVVGTVMTNMGLESALRRMGIGLVRSPVGDRYVMEEMLRSGAVLGGEPSGHVIFRDHGTTGDGIVTALQVLIAMVDSGKPLADLRSAWKRFPQIMRNLPVGRRAALEGQAWYSQVMEEARRAMGPDSILSLRYSGTEPVLRVTVSCASEEVTREVCDRICERITRELGK